MGKAGVPLAEPRFRVHRYLYAQGGEIADPSGRCVAMIAEGTGASRISVSNLLLAMEADGQVVRDVGTKRTYKIALGPNAIPEADVPPPPGWEPEPAEGDESAAEADEATAEGVAKLEALRAGGEPVAPPAGVLVAERLAAEDAERESREAWARWQAAKPAGFPPEPEPAEVLAPSGDLSALALELLVQVAGILNGDHPTTDDEAAAKLAQVVAELELVKRRLAEALERNGRLERKLSEANAALEEQGEKTVAVRAERDGLRARLVALEANVSALLKGDVHANDAARRAVERHMQAVPSRR